MDINIFNLIHNATDIDDCAEKLLDAFGGGWACERCPAYGLCTAATQFHTCDYFIDKWLHATIEIEKTF